MGACHETVLDCNCPLCVADSDSTSSSTTQMKRGPAVGVLRDIRRVSTGQNFHFQLPFASYTVGLNGETLVCHCATCEGAALAAARATLPIHQLKKAKSHGLSRMRSKVLAEDHDNHHQTKDVPDSLDAPTQSKFRACSNEASRTDASSGNEEKSGLRDVLSKQIAIALIARMRRSVKSKSDRNIAAQRG